MIVLASVFRNSTEYLERHADQVERLRKIAHEPVYVIAAEGDSEDDTFERLQEMQYCDEILKVEHGGPSYGSIVHTMRWRQLSVACNAALCAATRVIDPGDKFLYVESDLVWEPEMMTQLLEHLRGPVRAVAPMSMMLGAARFYDLWGHQKNGRMFRPHPPYFDGYDRDRFDLVPIDTAGSCFATVSGVVRLVEFSAIDCIRGIGRALAANNVTLWLDPTAVVYHP